jgi:hypothetical protein
VCAVAINAHFDPLLPVATVRFATNRQPKGGWS